MSMNSPFTTKTERGAYAEIVYIDGDLYVTEDTVGTLIAEETDAKTAIQAANDALPAAGGLIELSEGSFDISTQIALDSYTAVNGQGISTILNNLTTSWGSIFKITGTLGSEKKNISFSNMKLVGDKTKDQGNHIELDYCHYCNISNCWFGEGKLDGVAATNSKYCKTESNFFDNVLYGVDFGDCDNNRISGNSMSVRSVGIKLDTCDYSVIYGNDIKDQVWHGIYLLGISEKNVINGNNCQGSTSGIGIYLYYISGEGSPCRNSITGNSTCSNCDGIAVDESCCENTIIGNTSNGNTVAGGTGIEANNDSHRNTISDNICCENAVEGIHIGTNSDNNIMMGNQCYNSLYGVLIAAATADKNLIVGNILLNNSTANLSDLGTGTVKANNITS